MMRDARRQRGAVLFVSLIVLLVLSVITVTAARTSGIELLVANNTQFSTEAFLRAEAGVKIAEDYIETVHTSGGPAFDFNANVADGLYLGGGVDPSTTDWSDFGYERVLDAEGNETARYVIEYMGPISSGGASLSVGSESPTRHIYRITALGMAERGTSRLVSTIYATS